ncbi:hypothetical protein PFISCL1PPCAC_23772, partial [Pristionchus fissidentatus]
LQPSPFIISGHDRAGQAPSGAGTTTRGGPLPGTGTDPFGLAMANLPFEALAANLNAVSAALQQQHVQQTAQHQHQQQAALDQAAAAQAAAQQQQLQFQLRHLQQGAGPVLQQENLQQGPPPAPPSLPPTNPSAADEAMQQLQQLRRDRPRPRASKEEYIGVACHVCGAPADGMHYGAISCRSCNAFFRRAVTYGQTYECRFGGACDVSQQVDEHGNIDRSVRCACRACRHRKCLDAGMRHTAVQPPRDPTGSQKEKKKKLRLRESRPREVAGPSSSADLPSTSGLQESPGNVASVPRQSFEGSRVAEVKMELMDEDTGASSASNEYIEERIEGGGERGQIVRQAQTRQLPIVPNVERPWEVYYDDYEDYEKFDRLVLCYREHHRLMQLAMTPIETFLDQFDTGITLREMVPTDVSLLSTTELSGLLYWIEKLEPYKDLHSCDKRALFKRYSVRKLSLDHFYIASKWLRECDRGNFVMLNNTFVPPGKTGFELVTDDEKQIKAKAEIFLPTFERIWRCVIHPFARMKITDAEMVFLHTLLLWSPLNNMHVLSETKERMRLQREWAIKRLFEHYDSIGQVDPPVRFGEVCSLLAEVEVICDRHCQDFQVAKLFEFCDMSQFWYEKWCYSAVRFDCACDATALAADTAQRGAKRRRKSSPPAPFPADASLVTSINELRIRKAIGDNNVNTMQVPAQSEMSPLQLQLSGGDTLEEMLERELAKANTMPGSSSSSIEDPTMCGAFASSDADYTVPRKKAALDRTPSAPTSTPSTPKLAPTLPDLTNQ